MLRTTLLIAALAASGCVIHTTGRSTVVYEVEGSAYAQPVYVSVNQPPPPLRTAVNPGAKPYADAIWVAGHWHWRATGWVWIAGRWMRPRAGHVWEPPVCVAVSSGGYQYHPGYWRRANAAPPTIYRTPGTIRVHARRPGATVVVQRVPPRQANTTTVVVQPARPSAPSSTVVVQPRPATVTVRPAQPQQPATVTVRPSERPATVTVRPSQPQQPNTTVTVRPSQPQQPNTTVTVRPSERPANVTARPTTTARPATTTVRPSTTVRPTTTARPATTTARPATTVRPTTTARPATTTARPATTVRPTTTARPATTTARPATTVRPTTTARPATTVRPSERPTTMVGRPNTRPPTTTTMARPTTTVRPSTSTMGRNPNLNLQPQCRPAAAMTVPGGTLVLRGSNLDAVTAVNIGSQALAIVSKRGNEIRARVPQRARDGAVRIRVGNRQYSCGRVTVRGGR